MKLFPRKSKTARSGAHSYFGDFGETPMALSLVRAAKPEEIGEEPRHYSQAGYKFFVATEGAVEVEVDNESYVVDPDHALMIEPKEVHRVLRSMILPCTYLVFGTVKDPTGADKVVVE